MPSRAIQFWGVCDSFLSLLKGPAGEADSKMCVPLMCIAGQDCFWSTGFLMLSVLW